MDFSFTKKEEEYRRTLRIWLEENLPEGWIEGKTRSARKRRRTSSISEELAEENE